MGLEVHSVSSWTITPVVLALGQAVNSTVRIKIGMSTSTLTNTHSITPTTIIHSSFLPDDVCFFTPLVLQVTLDHLRIFRVVFLIDYGCGLVRFWQLRLYIKV